MDSERVKRELAEWGNSIGDELLKQQLLIFAEKVLSLNKSMKRYADDLPDLAQAAADADRNIRSQALSAAKAHAQNMEKTAKKLQDLLSHAFPDPGKKEKKAGQEHESKLAGKTLSERALCFSKAVTALSDRIDHFIYPKNFAVDLKELRKPALLEELQSIQETNYEFIKSLGKP